MTKYSDSRKLLMLLNLVSVHKEQLIDMAKIEIEQTEAYKTLTSLEDYYYLSDNAKKLKYKIKNIHFIQDSLEDLYKEFDKLSALINKFNQLVKNSTNKINKAEYKLDIIKKETYRSIKEKGNTYSKFLTIMIKSNETEPVLAFRHYLKTHSDKDVMNEYLMLRKKELVFEDRQRQDNFILTGLISGFFLFPFFYEHYLIEYGQYGLMKFITVCFAIFFVIGLFKGRPYFNFFTSGSILLTITILVLITIVQATGKLPQTFTIAWLKNWSFEFILACIGGLMGLITGNGFNRLPKRPFTLPKIFVLIHKHIVTLVLFSVIYGFIWVSAFINEQSIVQLAAAKMQENIVTYKQKAQQVALKEQEKGEQVQGILEVSRDANVRYEPSMNGEKFGFVNKGERFKYFGYEEDEDQRKWYKLEGADKNKSLWISEKTVTIIE